MRRPNEEPLPKPLAYFFTWHTYGTWLPGDERGWVKYHRGDQLPDERKRIDAAARMREGAVLLDLEQRQMVETTINDHCKLRGWTLHVVNCRSNHVHVVLSADEHPDVVRSQLKAWCTKRLKHLEDIRATARTEGNLGAGRRNWWGERGSRRYINDEDSLEAAILYVRDAQDRPH
jgi:REP element-mobilizing transposase RayT